MIANRGRIVSDAEFRRWWADDALSNAEIGARLGITASAVTFRGKSRSLPPRRCGPMPMPMPDDALMMQMWRDGVRIDEIAKVAKCHRHKVREWFKARGCVRPRNAGPKLKLDDWSQVQVIRAMAAQAAATTEAMRDAEMMDGRIGQKRKAA